MFFRKTSARGWSGIDLEAKFLFKAYSNFMPYVMYSVEQCFRLKGWTLVL